MSKRYNQGVADANRRRTKHGHATRDEGTSRMYQTWLSMKARCLNPSHQSYARYGGRGVTVCEKWVNSFESFYRDVGDPPSLKHTLDRIDNDRGYEPSNVRWATRKEQSNNISTNVWVEYDGKRMTWAQWADYLDVPYSLLMARVRKRRPIEEILKPRQNRKYSEPITFDGKSMPLRDWAKVTGIKYQTLYARWKSSGRLY